MKSNLDKRTRAQLAKKHACYILITCDQAEMDGNMHVEMTYEGDPNLAACMLQGAQSILEEEVNECCLA
jgi:hypothetical protein